MQQLNNILKNPSPSLWMFITALFTALGSELKILPFSDEQFRFGLGSIIFLLLILIRSTSIILTGVVTSIIIVLFRTIIGVWSGDGEWLSILSNHLPAAVFYILFACCLSFFHIEQFKTKPLFLGSYVAISELISNTAEHLVRLTILGQDDIYFYDLLLLLLVAFFRSFFVVGIYSSIIISEQKKQVQKMLNVGSELYVEILYLQKAMDNIEQITKSSYELYRELMKKKDHTSSLQALTIAQEIHEVKKDTQRIYAGISTIVGENNTTSYSLSELLYLVVEANKNYSMLLNKKITFHTLIRADFQTNEHIALLALLNNLTANAVEAITKNGEIHISIDSNPNETYIIIKDNGPGITKDILPIIFEPGYTSKFNLEGVAATGIGLSHVSEIVSRLEGFIQVESEPGQTVFQITIPTNTIQLGD